MSLHLPFELGYLLVETDQKACVGCCGGRIGGGDGLGQAEVFLPQLGLDRGGFLGPAVPAVAGQNGGDLGAGQLRRCLGCRGFGEEFQRVGAGQCQVGVGVQGGGEVFAQ
ncbi:MULTISPECIES: hypothetical protein [unclassified Streptomyces]|uniref:hypothetical protein n=1 Tax=unclassified Streptomyces TaxID=2593676 RepID=UPI003816A589